VIWILDVVTMRASSQWMERDAVARALDRMVKPEAGRPGRRQL
jgi:hypothetical protein